MRYLSPEMLETRKRTLSPSIMILVPWTATVTARCEASSEGQGAIEVSMYSIEYEVGYLQPELADGPRSQPPAAQAHPPWPPGSPDAPGRQPALAAA
jgi:hypothetical protein